MSRMMFFLMLLLSGVSPIIWADGMLIPIRPELPRFSVPYHRVKVTLDRQVATTDIDQAFRSHASQPMEGTYIFPIADGMSISKFAMYVNNEPLTYRTLEKEEARRIYNGIVSSRRDPALLEWLGTRMIQARVFPIQPGEDKRIRIAYQEVLKADGGLIKYVYPLKTEKMSARNLEECSVDITIKSAQPIRSVYSPTHSVTVEREGEHIARVSYHAKNVLPDQDLVLYYTVSEKDMGLDLLTYRDAEKGGDGYFLLLLAPKADLRANEVQPKDVIFVLDKSGSMAGDGKIEQAKAALKFCLNSLDQRDRFNVIAYNEEVRPWQREMRAANRDDIRDAEAFVNAIHAEGSTNIDDALKSSLRMLKEMSEPGRPSIIIFLTDGLPTSGETNVEAILANVKRANTFRARIFNFGVGYDYNAHFLDMLADANHGTAENVLPREDIEAKVSSFYTRIAAPVQMNLKLDWGDADVHDLYPRELPDLFKGSQLLLTGRYHPHAGGSTLRLTGEAAGKRQTFTYDVTLPNTATNDDSIPRLWATRKIGYLEDQARLNGANKEIMEEIIRLSKEFGILTEYTAFLVDTDVTVSGAPSPRILSRADADNASFAMDSIGTMRNEVAGASGVAQSVNRKANMYAAQAQSTNGSTIVTGDGRRVQISQMRNINQRSFVQSGTQWVDVNYKTTQRVIKVKAFSPAYFQLVNANPRLARFLSQDANVTVAVKDLAIETGKDGQEAEFTPVEFKEIKTKIDAELGVSTAALGGAASLAMATLPRVPAGWAWALALALPVGLLRRFRHARRNV